MRPPSPTTVLGRARTHHRGPVKLSRADAQTVVPPPRRTSTPSGCRDRGTGLPHKPRFWLCFLRRRGSGTAVRPSGRRRVRGSGPRRRPVGNIGDSVVWSVAVAEGLVVRGGAVVGCGYHLPDAVFACWLTPLPHPSPTESLGLLRRGSRGEGSGTALFSSLRRELRVGSSGSRPRWLCTGGNS